MTCKRGPGFIYTEKQSLNESITGIAEPTDSRGVAEIVEAEKSQRRPAEKFFTKKTRKQTKEELAQQHGIKDL